MASVVPYNVEHTFEQGLLTDLPATKTPRTALTGGRNLHLLNDGLEGEQQILQADRGNAYRAGMPEGWFVMGSAGFNGIEYFLLAEVDANGYSTGRGQIGSFPSPQPNASGNPNDAPPATGMLLERYRPLHNFQPYVNNTPSDPTLYPFDAYEFNFSLERPVQVELQPDYDGTVNIIFNEPHDAQNPPRIINSRFAQLPGGRYKIIDRNGERDANLYSPASFSSTIRLFQRSRSLVQVEFIGLLDGGQVSGGMWQYYFAYVNQDGQPTDIIAWSPRIPVFDGSHMGTIRGTQGATTRRVSLRLTGLDTDYQFVRCYAVRRFGEGASEAVAVTQLRPDFRLAEASLSFQHTGYEQTLDYDQSLLSLRTGDLETVGPMSQVDNMLAFVGGRSQVYDANALRDFASSISISVAYRQLHAPGVYDDGLSMGTGQHDPFTALDWGSTLGDGRVGGYLNPWNVAYRLGYPSGEALAFGIVFRLTGGNDSAVFPLRGHDHLLSQQGYTQNAADLDSDGWATSGENIDGVFRFPQVSTAGGPSSISNGQVMIMGVNFKLPQLPAAVRQAAVGCYFVRLKRNPDRLCQGYAVSVLNSVIVSRDNEFHDHGHDEFKFCDAPTYARRDANLKAIPAPAAILESSASHLDSDDIESHALPFEFISFLNNNRYIINPWRVAFYSPDTVADPARLRSSLQGRNMRLSLQAYMLARAAVRTTHPNEDGRGTFKVWKTVSQQTGFIETRSVKGYWTEAGSTGSNDGGFGGHEKYLLGKGNRDDVRFLMQNNYDDYLGLVSSTSFDSARSANSPWRKFTNNYGSFGEGTGQPLGSNIASTLPNPRIVAWLINLYPEYSSNDNTAAQTQGARPRDVLRDLYNIDSEGYFPISPVLSFDQLESQLDYQRNFCCFGGDTYKGVSYRRLFTNIRGDQATSEIEWTKQIVGQSLSMVCESDVNPYAGREKEVQARPGEGAPRTWWAAVWEDSGRDPRSACSDSFKAYESAGYNAGFANAGGATLQLALPRNLPFLATEYPNQIAVTSTHTPGGYQNGYRRYVPGSAQTYNRELGSILSLRTQGRTLVAGFERGIATVSVNERTQAGSDTGGPTFLEVRQVLSPYSNVLSREVGVLSQFATAATDEAVYGLDYTGAWQVKALEFVRLSSLRVEKELLPRLRYLGHERPTFLLRRMVQLALDKTRGDVIFSIVNNALAPLADATSTVADPYELASPTGYVADGELPANPYRTPTGSGPAYDWSPVTCLQMVYSYRLDKWLPATDYLAQHQFSQGSTAFYSIPLPDASGGGRQGFFRHGRNIGYYYDQPHYCMAEITITGNDPERRQVILNNLVLVSNNLLPHHIDYVPQGQALTSQRIFGPATGNISQRNAEYREDRVLVTVPAHGRRQRARAIVVRIYWNPKGNPLRLDSILASLADSMA